MDRNRTLSTLLLFVICLLSNGKSEDDGPVFFEEWENIKGKEIKDLTESDRYPDKANKSGHQTHLGLEKEYFAKRHEMGMRMRTYLMAPLTGKYFFYTACDDTCRLFLSSDDSPANKQVIVNQESYTAINSMAWRSPPQELVAGSLYYMELLYKESDGENYANVSMERPDGKFESPIGEEHLRRNAHRTDRGLVFYEEWSGEGSQISNLTRDKNYPMNATVNGHVTTMQIKNEPFSMRRQYGVRMRAYFLAPLTGSYTFYTTCDDSCQLFLSTDVNPKTKRMIIDQPEKASVNSRKRSSQAQTLVEGKLYYMELLFKAGDDDNHAEVSVLRPDGKREEPLSEGNFRLHARGLDLPGKDCVTEGDENFPNYVNCKRFTQTEKLEVVRSALQELQWKLKNTSNPSETELKETMKTAGRKITFLLEDPRDDPGIPQDPANSNLGWEVTREVEELGGLVAEVANISSPLSVEYPSVILQIKELDEDFTFPDPSQKPSFSSGDEIRIKQASKSGKIVVFSALYKNLESILQRNISSIDGDGDDAKSRYFLNSRIITSFMVPHPPRMDRGGVNIRLDHTQFKGSSHKAAMMCAFWNFSSHGANNSMGSWSSHGCRVDQDSSDANKTACLCDHLTHFAVLMKVTADPEPLPEGHTRALQSITYIGCAMSLIGEMLTVLAITGLRLTRSETNIIHLHLVIALALSQLFFLAGIGATSNKGLCKFIAVALHFFNLVAFCWMLVEGVWLYFMVVRVFDTGYNRIKRYIIAAWTLPVVIVIVTLASSFDGYGTEHSCWLSVERGTIWGFVIPVLIIVLTNGTILGMVVREILQLHTPANADDNKLSTVRSGVKSAMVLLPILGVTWVFGVLAVNSYTLVFQYLFAIFNSMQGFFIFVFHCLLNSEVRKAFYRKKQIWSESHLFHSNSQSPPHKYDSEACKESQSTSMEKRPHSSTSTSKIVLK
ncbi:adhesion G protein-coupled receptor L4 isoform X2 [Nematostella vectensis]|uniref:adhesion G protein-coupled receptor L4 isoform X2 n=1 Tax=Nematostella vectensis TaxID=45351 RepID=UPI00207756A1|nr:adhesion G protein-coupled receptor L4 isoform X2 [Nematostella vectensis]